jgi:hypothetical protein
MTFVFPMAGESRRFAQAGYQEPKFRLPIHGASLFDHVVRGFAAYFDMDLFVFIARDSEAAGFVTERCQTLGIAKPVIVTLDTPTAGQAETVFLGLEKAGIDDSEAVTIFNIDTIRPGYSKPARFADPAWAGYLEVFHGTGEQWSFVAPDPDDPDGVARVTEKLPISDLCCTGLYHFRRAGDFRWTYRNPAPPASEAERRERYVAPLYNSLIARGDRIAFRVIDPSRIVFCGTPEQYEHVAASEEIGRRLRP